MNKSYSEILVRAGLAAVTLGLLGLSEVHAQLDRTWVSPSGNDTNNCSINKPCRTFAGAIQKTNAGGEIVVQESGGFGPVTINKSITIDGGGKYAGIQTPSGGDAITVQAGSSDVVVLRGLTINGLGTGAIGVDTTSSLSSLQVDSCVIKDFTTKGIYATSTTVLIYDTLITECGLRGIDIESSSKAVVEHSRLENNGTGLYLLLGSQVTVRETVAAGNANYGFQVDWGDLNIQGCVASNNGTGIYATVVPSPNGPSTVTVSNSTVTNNQNYGFQQSSTAVFYSRGNNTVRGNGTDTSGTITQLAGT
jgi:hypothetical protein